MPKKKKEKKQSSTKDLIDPNPEEVTVFVNPPSETQACPIHKGVFTRPVIARCGHTFCYNCLKKHLKQDDKCPIDSTKLKLKETFPNLALAEQTKQLLIYCKYGCKKGEVEGTWVENETEDCCKEIITYGERSDHEKNCQFALIKCPYSENCPMFRRMDLEEHKKHCNRITCPHQDYGCNFIGPASDIEEHLKECTFEKMKIFFKVNSEKYEELKTTLNTKSSENNELKHKVKSLNKQLNSLSDTVEKKNQQFEIFIKNLTASLDSTQNQLNDVLQEIRKMNLVPANNVKLLEAKKPEVKEFVEKEGNQLDRSDLICKGTFTGHSGPVWSLALAIDQHALVSASSDTLIKVWDLTSFKCKQTLAGHTGIVHAVAVIGSRIFSGSSDKTIRVWNMDTMLCIKTLELHDNTVCSLVVTTGYLFSGSYAQIKVWDLENYECVKTLSGHNHWVRALCDHGGYLYSGSYNSIKMWDLATFECETEIGGQDKIDGSIYSLCICKNRLLGGTYENVINVWDLESREFLFSIPGHIGAIYTLAASTGDEDDNKFFSGSYDSTIKVWNVEGILLQTLFRHTSSVEVIICHGNTLFSGSADGTIKIWR